MSVDTRNERYRLHSSKLACFNFVSTIVRDATIYVARGTWSARLMKAVNTGRSVGLGGVIDFRGR